MSGLATIPPTIPARQGFLNSLTPAQKRAIGAAGFALSGVPIALSAMNELNGDPTNPLANAGGAVGSLGLGAAGALAGGVLGAPFGGPIGSFIGRTIGGLAGSALGGSLGAGAVKGIQSLTSDPVGNEIGANERRVASAMKTQNMAAWQQLPVQMAYQRAEDASDARRAAIAADLNSRNAYMQALLGAAMNPSRSYTDPAAAQLMASALSSGIA